MAACEGQSTDAVGSHGGGVSPSPYLISTKEVGDCIAVFLVSVDAADAVLSLAELGKEASDFLALESAVTPRGNAVCPDSSVVATTPQGVRMDMEESGYFPHRHQVTHVFAISHILSDLLFN